MGLSEAIAGIANALAGLSGIDVVLTEPPRELTADKTAFLYERPGPSRADTNTSFVNTDVVFVQFHRRIAADPAAVISDTRTVFDAMRARLWARGKNGRFGGTVIGLTGIGSDGPMPMEYGEAVTFAFTLRLDILHGARIEAS